MEDQNKHLHSEPEYKVRAHYGVVACVRVLEDGRVRLILDDVCSASDYWPQEWQSHYPFTQNDFDPQAFLNCRLSEPELAQIGLILVTRLSALTNNEKQL